MKIIEILETQNNNKTNINERKENKIKSLI